MDLESLKWDRHNLDLYRIERRLEEYIGLKNEREIRIEEDYLRLCRNLKLVFFEDNSPQRGTADWDFANTNWELDTSNYVSSPASLHMWDNHSACKITETLDIPEGRIVAYLRFFRDWGVSPNFPLILAFRNNDDVGTVTTTTEVGLIANGYNFWLGAYEKEARLYEGDSLIVTKSLVSYPADAHVFNKYRITFWISDGVLIVRPEWYDESAEEWKKLADDLTDSTPAFEEPNNRIGIGANDGDGWFDDIEIWKRI